MKLSALATTLCLGLVLFGSLPIAAAKDQGDHVEIRVSVFNYVPISPHTLEAAEGEAGRVLRDAGVDVLWLNCLQDGMQSASFEQCIDPSFRTHFDLRIVRSSRNPQASVLGIAFFADDGQGCCADLFYQEVQRLQKAIDVSVILGHAMAHELGHLLLGMNAHSPSGIMRAHWTREDLKSASRGCLQFSSEQSRRIKSRLAPGALRRTQTIEASTEKPVQNDLSSRVSRDKEDFNE